jgi:hypothetical protein
MDEEVECNIPLVYARRCTLMSRVVWFNNMKKLDLGITRWGSTTWIFRKTRENNGNDLAKNG